MQKTPITRYLHRWLRQQGWVIDDVNAYETGILHVILYYIHAIIDKRNNSLVYTDPLALQHYALARAALQKENLKKGSQHIEAFCRIELRAIKPKRSTIRLTLTKEWFDMILKGKKKEEYRDIKPYWQTRLMHPDGHKGYKFIEFRNGYGKKAPFIKVECRGIYIDFSRPELNAGKTQRVYVIRLGKILKKKYIKK